MKKLILKYEKMRKENKKAVDINQRQFNFVILMQAIIRFRCYC